VGASGDKLRAVLIAFLVYGGLAYASPMDEPFGYFNVYSLHDIGTPTSRYHGDFQGIAGAAGDVYFADFSLEGLGPSSRFGLHVGDSAELTGTYVKGVEAYGSVAIIGATIGNDLVAGGDVTNPAGYGGTVAGDVIAQGEVLLDN